MTSSHYLWSTRGWEPSVLVEHWLIGAHPVWSIAVWGSNVTVPGEMGNCWPSLPSFGHSRLTDLCELAQYYSTLHLGSALNTAELCHLYCAVWVPEHIWYMVKISDTFTFQMKNLTCAPRVKLVNYKVIKAAGSKARLGGDMGPRPSLAQNSL